MSRESATAFLQKLNSDPSLRAQVLASSGENVDEVTLSGERLVELGNEHGFVFTLEEIHAAFTKRAASTSRELDDRELEAVAGGKAQMQDFHFVVRIDKASPIL